MNNKARLATVVFSDKTTVTCNAKGVMINLRLWDEWWGARLTDRIALRVIIGSKKYFIDGARESVRLRMIKRGPR